VTRCSRFQERVRRRPQCQNALINEVEIDLPLELMLSNLSSSLPTIKAFAPSPCASLAFVIKSHSPLRTSANQVSFCPGCRVGFDGHNGGQPVLAVALRLGSVCGYTEDENAGGGGCVRRSSILTQGTVNDDRGII
jgi:hypothetical protein